MIHKQSFLILPSFPVYLFYHSQDISLVSSIDIITILFSGQSDIIDIFQRSYNRMRKIGLIYNRDTSKNKQTNNNTLSSHPKNINNRQHPHYHALQQNQEPCMNIKDHLRKQKGTKVAKQTSKVLVQKGWKLSLDNVTDSSLQNSMQTNQGYFQTDCRELTDQDSKQAQSQNIPATSKPDSQILTKMECIDKVLNQIRRLRTCQLKNNQNTKINEIEDRLMNLQRKILQKQKENYLQ